MNKHMTQEVAIKSAWMILEGLGYDRARNGELEKTVAAVFASAPAADVVEVVRCRDCKHNITSSTRQFYQWCDEHHEYHVPDWFCADGKRKDGGKD